MKYTNCILWVNGIIQFQNQSFDIDSPDNATDVPTIPGGHQGSALGPPQTIVDITNAVPAAGADFDFNAAKQAGTIINVRIQQIGSKESPLVGKFQVRGNTRSGSAGAPVTEKNKLHSLGVPAPWFNQKK